MPLVENHQPARNPPGWLGPWPAPLVLFLICAGFYWKLVFTNQYTWLDSPDLAHQVLPWYQFQAGEWHRGQFPLWDPYLWGGQPLIGQAQPGAAYPLNWILFLLPLRHGWIRQGFLHWYLVLIHFMAALFCYWLCRDLKRSREGSLLAGIAFGLGGYIGTTDWPQMLNGAVWAPLVFLFLLRAQRGDRVLLNSAFAGTCLGMAFLSGHHQIPIFEGLAAGAFWIYMIFSEPQVSKRLWASAVAVFATFTFLVSALQTLPAYEYGKLAVRWVGVEQPVGWTQAVPYTVHSEYSLYPLSLLGIIFPTLHRHADPFVGFTIVILALTAVGLSWRDRPVRIFLGVLLGGLVLALGQHSIFHGVIYALVPMVEKARNPSMAVLIFNLGICTLSSYGVDVYFSKTNPNQNAWTRKLTIFSVALGATVFILLLAFSMVQIPKAADHDRLALTGVVGFVLAGALAAWRTGLVSPKTLNIVFISLCLMELGNVSEAYYRHQNDPNSFVKKLVDNKDIVDFIRTDETAPRVEINDQEIAYNWGDWHGIDQFGGYLASLTENINLVQANYWTRMLFGAKYFVGSKPIRPSQQEVFEGKSTIKVYVNPEAFPRTWVVHRVEGIRNRSDIIPSLDTYKERLRKEAFVIGPAPQLEFCEGTDGAELLSRDTNWLFLSAELKCRGMVVVSETYFPGWEAKVDGVVSPIYEAYGVLRGVVVEPGTHRIEMRYRPKSVYLGAVFTSAGLLGAAVLALRARRS